MHFKSIAVLSQEIEYFKSVADPSVKYIHYIMNKLLRGVDIVYHTACTAYEGLVSFLLWEMAMDLVSVVVVTYNSEDTIVELLDSIACQSYMNLELIVADDCSSDRTVELVRQWLVSWRDRFAKAVVSASKKRQGVVYNADRGIRKSHSNYIKVIGGDDVLLPNCIEDNINFIQRSGDQFVFSKVQLFGNRKMIHEKKLVAERSYQLLKEGNQLNMLKEMWLPTPSGFFSMDLYKELGGYDKRFPNWEDAPFYTKMIRRGIPFGFLDEETVRYRLHKNNHSIYRGFVVDFIKVYIFVRIPALLSFGEFRLAFKAFKVVCIKIQLLLKDAFLDKSRKTYSQ